MYTTRDAQAYLSILHLHTYAILHIKALKSKTASSHLVHQSTWTKLSQNAMPGLPLIKVDGNIPIQPQGWSQRRSCFQVKDGPNMARLRHHKNIFPFWWFFFHRGQALWISMSSCLCSPKSCSTLPNSGRQGKAAASASTRQGQQVTMATVLVIHLKSVS